MCLLDYEILNELVDLLRTHLMRLALCKACHFSDQIIRVPSELFLLEYFYNGEYNIIIKIEKLIK
jgi:hypothetical protein